MENKVYVVTGGTSFIASGLIWRLVAEGKTVYAICRPNSSRMYRLPESEQVKRISCELSELHLAQKNIPEKCDVFFHLGWSTSEKNDMQLQTLNIKYTLDAVALAKNLGCHTFIGAGTQAEYGLANVKLTEQTPCFPVNGYGMAKLCAGQMSRRLCEDVGIKHIWTRIVSVYGPMEPETTMIMSLIQNLKMGKEMNLSGCEQIWDYMYIDDCARALHLIADKGKNNEIYVVGSGEERPLKDYVEIVRNVVGNHANVNFGAVPYSNQTPMYLSADTSKLKESFEFFCEESFETGIKSMIEE